MTYKLLNIDGNPKTVKGQKQGYMTAILYLAPWKSAGINLCPMAELAGCYAGCLNTAGHGGIPKRGYYKPHGIKLPRNDVQAARIRRTRLFADDRELFMRELCSELERFIKKAERKGLKPVVRLNGTSDILFEKIAIPGTGTNARPFSDKPSIMAAFPELTFYDYTKIAKRFERPLPANYHLSLSYSEASPVYKARCIDYHKRLNVSLVIVCRTEAIRDAQVELGGVNGDLHDLRFTDKPGSLVYLKAKGSARKDTSGFVTD